MMVLEHHTTVPKLGANKAFGTSLVPEALVGTKFWHCCLVPQDLVSTSDNSNVPMENWPIHSSPWGMDDEM
jgi:hypothetical protein